MTTTVFRFPTLRQAVKFACLIGIGIYATYVFVKSDAWDLTPFCTYAQLAKGGAITDRNLGIQEHFVGSFNLTRDGVTCKVR